ncbi:hypothetical protein G7046_g9313 [Stylonectria norvegica]|nr:hypothetical protein G7046_g9313 [Stylonectria norvegica]
MDPIPSRLVCNPHPPKPPPSLLGLVLPKWPLTPEQMHPNNPYPVASFVSFAPAVLHAVNGSAPRPDLPPAGLRCGRASAIGQSPPAAMGPGWSNNLLWNLEDRTGRIQAWALNSQIQTRINDQPPWRSYSRPTAEAQTAQSHVFIPRPDRRVRPRLPPSLHRPLGRGPLAPPVWTPQTRAPPPPSSVGPLP